MFELENHEALLNADARNYLKGQYPDHYDMTVGRIGYVKNDIDTIRKSFISLGFHLHELDMCAEYVRCGYADFYVFCEDVFHLSRSSVQRYIAVWEKFCEYEKNEPKMWIAKEYKDFNFSQLVEMLNMPYPEVAKPDMTVDKLRELKKKQINAQKGISNEPDLNKALDQLKDTLKDFKLEVAQMKKTAPSVPEDSSNPDLVESHLIVGLTPDSAEEVHNLVSESNVCDVAQASEEYGHNFARLDFPNGNILISDFRLPESLKMGLTDYLTSLKIDYISSDADFSSVCNMINQLQDFIMSL